MVNSAPVLLKGILTAVFLLGLSVCWAQKAHDLPGETENLEKMRIELFKARQTHDAPTRIASMKSLFNRETARGNLYNAVLVLNEMESIVPNNDRLNSAWLLTNRGDLFFQLKEYSQAIDNYTAATDVWKELRDHERQLFSIKRAAECYSALELYIYLEDITGYGIEVAQTTGVDAYSLELYKLHGLANIHLTDYPHALKALDTALTIAIAENKYRTVPEIYNLQSEILLRMGNLKEANETAESAHFLFSSTVDSVGMANSYHMLAKIAQASRKSDYAIEYYTLSNIYAEDKGMLKLIGDNLLQISQLYEAQGNLVKSLEYYKQYGQVLGETYLEQEEMRIAEVRAKQNYLENIAELDFLRKENENARKLLMRNKLILLSVLYSVILLAVIVGLLYQRRHLENKQRLVELNQKLLRNQLNPHFVFNAMNAIQSFMLVNAPMEAANYLTKFARLLRMTFNHSKNDSVSLQEEIQLLSQYMEIQKLRFGDRLSYEIRVLSGIQPSITLIPPMLVQPFLESFTENISLSKTGALHLNVVFSKESSGKISVEIRSMTEMHQALETIISSSTISLTQSRLRLLNKDSRSAPQIRFVDEKGGTQGSAISFIIPFKLQEAA